MQAMCFLAGANSIFYGEKLLTTPNPETNEDMALFAKLGIAPEQREVAHTPDEEAAALMQATANTDNDQFYNAASA